MNLNEITVLVWDEPANFHSQETQRSFGSNKIFKELIQFNSLDEFKIKIEFVKDEEKLVFCCHVKMSDLSLYEEFRNSGIIEKFNIPVVHYLSSSPEVATLKFREKFGENEKIQYYNKFITGLKSEEIKTFTKKTLFLLNIDSKSNKQNNKSIQHEEYAIITALYKDEFQELEKIFDFPENERIVIHKKVFLKGYLKSDRSKKVIAAFQNSSGMVDAAMLASLIINTFTPTYLLMPGVCGGSIDRNFGDIIIAQKTFTFQKGKLSDIKRKDETGKLINIELFDSNKNIIDENHLYDKDGNQIIVSIEKFDIEHDAMISLDTSIEDMLNLKMEGIKEKINISIQADERFKSKKNEIIIDIDIQPMACSTMVINKDGFFEKSIQMVTRKVAAVEMESYGIARACQFANEGQTIPIIFKSVMDKTSNKADRFENGFKAKEFAAFTSAQFLKYLLEENVI